MEDPGLWYEDNRYYISQKILTLGKKYHLFDSDLRPVGFCARKGFSLRDDIRIYRDQEMSVELLRIHQQQILNLNGTFRVTDSATAETVGYLGRRAFRSLIRDTWSIYDPGGVQKATIHERGIGLPIAKRVYAKARLIPKYYRITRGGEEFARVSQNPRIIGDRWVIKIRSDPPIDRRLIISAAILMDVIEQSITTFR